MIESVRFTAEERQQLIDMKRRTGLDAWNVLGRWSLLLSLSNEERVSLRPKGEVRTALEIDWDTFSGPMADHILAVLELRAGKVDPDSSPRDLVLAHLARGIAQLGQETASGRSLVSLLAL